MTLNSHVASEEPRRSAPRLRLGIPARLETLDGTVEVDLLDLSLTGAKIALDPVLRIRTGVLHWLGFEALGDVVWQEGGLRGIIFDEPLANEHVVATRLRAPSAVGDSGTIEAARAWATGSYDRMDQTTGRAV